MAISSRAEPPGEWAEGAKEDMAAGAATRAKRTRQAMDAVQISLALITARLSLTTQSDWLMARRVLNDDTTKLVRIMGNTAALNSVSALILNSLCGKLSDVVGRKAFCVLSSLVFLSTDLATLVWRPTRLIFFICHFLRASLGSLGSALMPTAIIMDVCEGQDAAVAGTSIGLVTAIFSLAAPFVETLLLRHRRGPRLVYLVGLVLSMAHLLHSTLALPETLPASKVVALKACLTLQSINPFGFLNFWTRCSGSLRRLATITSLQYITNSATWGGFEEVWKREHLKWGNEMCRNIIVLNGLHSMMGCAVVQPILLQKLSAKGFTTLANWLNAAAFILRGLVQNGLCIIGSNILLLPGANAASARALEVLGTARAQAEGISGGDMAAWIFQLRALCMSMAPAISGNWYAFCRNKGIYPGTTYMVVAALGALLPQAMLVTTCKPSDLELPPGKGDQPLKENATAPAALAVAVGWKEERDGLCASQGGRDSFQKPGRGRDSFKSLSKAGAQDPRE